MTRPFPRRRSLIVGVLALCLGPVEYASAISTNEADQHMEQARAYGAATSDPKSYAQGVGAMARGELDAARTAFAAAVTEVPKHLPSLILLSEVELRQRQFEAADSWIKQARLVDAGDARVLTQEGKYLYLTGKPDDAQKKFEEAIAKSPESAAAYVELGALQLAHLKDAKRAAQSYGQAVRLAPEQLTYRYGLATALSQSGQLELALGVLEDLAARVPKDPVPWQVKAGLLNGAGRLDEALLAFDQAVRRGPQQAPLRFGRAQLIVARGQAALAEPDLEAVIRLQPTHGEALFMLANLLLQRGDFANAEPLYKRLIEIEPENADAFNNLAFGAMQDKTRLDDALAWAQRATALRPQDPNIKDTLAWVHRERGDLAAARDLLNSIPAPQRSGQIHYHLGIVLLDMADKPGAKHALQAAVNSQEPFFEQEQAKSLLSELSAGAASPGL